MKRLSIFLVGALALPAIAQQGDGTDVSVQAIEWFVGHLLRSDEDKKDTRPDLEHANLAGLPAVTNINATLDPLRSDGGILEKALDKAGVPVARKIFTGVAHEFFGCAAVVEKAAEAQAFAAERLRGSLGWPAASASDLRRFRSCAEVVASRRRALTPVIGRRGFDVAHHGMRDRRTVAA